MTTANNGPPVRRPIFYVGIRTPRAVRQATYPSAAQSRDVSYVSGSMASTARGAYNFYGVQLPRALPLSDGPWCAAVPSLCAYDTACSVQRRLLGVGAVLRLLCRRAFRKAPDDCFDDLRLSLGELNFLALLGSS